MHKENGERKEVLMLKDEFLRHLSLDDVLMKNRNILFEDDITIERELKLKGLYPHAMTYARRFSDECLRRIDSGEHYFAINNLYDDIQDRFFDLSSFKVEVGGVSLGAMYVDKPVRFPSPNFNKETKRLFGLEIVFRFSDNSIKNKSRFCDIAEEFLLHEMLHAYDDYSRLKQNKESLYNVLDKSGYKNNVKNKSLTFSEMENVLRNVFYLVTDTEINANAAGIGANYKRILGNDITGYVSDEEKMELIKSTTAYKNLISLESDISFLKDFEDRKAVVLFWNSIAPEKHFKSFSRLMEFLEHKYGKLKHKFIDNVSFTFRNAGRFIKESSNCGICYMPDNKSGFDRNVLYREKLPWRYHYIGTAVLGKTELRKIKRVPGDLFAPFISSGKRKCPDELFNYIKENASELLDTETISCGIDGRYGYIYVPCFDEYYCFELIF